MANSRQPWLYSDSGILRKKDEDEELLVFGYSCKLFRDDEKALFIDQGKHLIPWMGDETLKIDRYDGRGALYDLRSCEAPAGGYDSARWDGLTESERRVEQLCDDERYRALNLNEEEEALYQEEELKRLHQALGSNSYGQVGFTYDDNSNNTSEGAEDENVPKDEAGDEAFVPPNELDLPVNMVVPETVKLNAVIEKTAIFISQQGPQMEILLKMKQAGNPTFQFLSFDSSLHPYYRHLLMAIKTGRYKPQQEKEAEVEPEDSGDDHYLHPLLAPVGSRVELAPSIPSINYKPSADCAYSMLVNKIKDKQAALGLRVPSPEPEEPVYYQEPVPEPVAVIAAPPVRYTQKKEPEHPPPAPEITSAPASKPEKKSKKHANSSKAIYPKNESLHIPTVSVAPEPELVQQPLFIMPPNDMQLIIDKMASYVAKNGRDFEAIVRSKGDSRFTFLDANNEYHAYYEHKVAFYMELESVAPLKKKSPSPHSEGGGEEEDEEEETVEKNSECGHTGGEESQDGMEESADSDGSSSDNSRKNSSKPAPVCFSIKKPKEAECVLELRSALPVEESSDEEEGQENEKPKENESKKKEPEKEQKVHVHVHVKEENEIIDLTGDTPVIRSNPVDKERDKERDRDRSREKDREREKKSIDHAKWAEERLKDKLAAAAREKVAAAQREKQLQLERKRRAAAFLNMIKKDSSIPNAVPVIGPQLPHGEPVQRISNDDDEVSSIPSPTSSDVPSPPHISPKDLQDRLNSRGNGDTKSALFARIQEAAKHRAKKRSGRSSSESDGEIRDSHSHLDDRHRRHKHKKRRSSVSVKRDHLSRSPAHSSHRRREEEIMKHKKFKKDSHIRSHMEPKAHHKHHYHSEKFYDHHDHHKARKEKHKSKKKSSKHKSGRDSDS